MIVHTQYLGNQELLKLQKTAFCLLALLNVAAFIRLKRTLVINKK